MAAVREGARRRARAAARVPSRLGREHLRDELRGAVGQRRRGAEPRLPRWRAACRTPARAASRRYHRNGGELVCQIGTGYFGCRDQHGRFDLRALTDTVAVRPVRALEIKLSQGAKPGLGGVLPGAKVSRGDRRGPGRPAREDCVSPSRHAEFSDVDEHARLRRDARRRDRAPGRASSPRSASWGSGTSSAALMARHRARGRLRDDRRRRGRHRRRAAGVRRLGAPAVPARLQPGLHDLRGGRAARAGGVRRAPASSGFPDNAVVAFALGADMVNVGREAMLSIGCVQAQKCHTDPARPA